VVASAYPTITRWKHVDVPRGVSHVRNNLNAIIITLALLIPVLIAGTVVAYFLIHQQHL